MQYCLDTGVLLRVFDRGDAANPKIHQALRRLLDRGDSVVTTAQNIAEFWNVWTRPTSARGGYGQSAASAARHVDFLLRFGQVLTESSASFTEWKHLVTKHSLQGVSVHDARIVAVISAFGISHLLTLNPADFQRYTHLVVLTPATLLAQAN
ncbi:MAG: PIN domain-containing protein [Pirellulales bacterium]